MDAEAWLEQFARAAEVPPPTPEQREQLLELASLAAHTSERLAAPLTCWLVGVAGLDPAEALSVGRTLADRTLH